MTPQQLSTSEPAAHQHVSLLADTDTSGRPVHEAVPARRLENQVYEITSSPVLVYGCAAGDVVEVAPDGRFQMLTRGGNLAIQVFAAQSLTAAQVRQLTSAFTNLGGVVEGPDHGRFVIVTVPVSVGFGAVEAVMADWLSTAEGVEWAFGNVYADDGSTLDWWTAR